MQQHPFDLIIFDCDGVLVDSEPVSNAVFADMLREIGLDLTLEEMFAEFVGLSMESCMEKVGLRLGRPPPEDFAARVHEAELSALAERVKPVRGVTHVLDALPIPCCVASSGTHDKMNLTLSTTGLLERFHGRLFSATEVPRGKPHPDVFLHAAKQMGVDPVRTAVVEDSPAGVTAGIAAGMTVFGYAAMMDAQRLRAAGATVFQDMGELPGLLWG
jgi:HAD superfamily hydrolase (TIGR01509 family)